MSSQFFSFEFGIVSLALLLISKLILFVSLIEWLYPPNRTPENARMLKMTRNTDLIEKTGSAVFPGTVLSLVEIRNAFLRKPYRGRGVELSEDEKKALQVIKENEICYLKSQRDLMLEPALNNIGWWSSMIPRSRDREFDTVNSCEPTDKSHRTKTLRIATIDEEQIIRKPLKRVQKDDRHINKKNNKKTMVALDILAKDISAREPEPKSKETLMLLPPTPRARTTGQDNKTFEDVDIKKPLQNRNVGTPDKSYEDGGKARLTDNSTKKPKKAIRAVDIKNGGPSILKNAETPTNRLHVKGLTPKNEDTGKSKMEGTFGKPVEKNSNPEADIKTKETIIKKEKAKTQTQEDA